MKEVLLDQSFQFMLCVIIIPVTLFICITIYHIKELEHKRWMKLLDEDEGEE